MHASVVGEGDAGAAAAAEAAGRLWTLRGRWRSASPFEASAASALFADLGTRLQTLHAAETAAVAQLVG